MDFSNLSREDWAKRLAGKSLGELRPILFEHGVDLPHINDRAAFVSAAYDIVCAPKKSAPDSGAPAPGPVLSTSAPQAGDPPAPESGPQLKIRCRMGKRYRCGKLFTTVYQMLPESAFSAAQLKELRADPCLQVVSI